MLTSAPPWHPPLDTASEQAAAYYLEGLHRHLTVLPAAGRSFDNAVKADPGFAVGAAALAVAATGVGELALARQALATARAAVPRVDAMSGSHIGAIDAILMLPTRRALPVTLAHLSAYPADALILALTLNSLHGSGRRTRRQEALALLDAALATGADHFVIPSLRSVIAADLGDLDRSRADAEAGLAANSRSAHAAHGMAHVFYETRDHEVGRDWLSTWTVDFDPRNSGVHLSWHLALHDLALGDIDRLLNRYSESIRPHTTPAMYVDAVDILWRSRLRGVDVKDKFAALRSVVGPPDGSRSTSLALTQAVVLTAGAGDRPALEDAVRTVSASTSELACREVVQPIAEALLAIEDADLTRAVARLESVDGALVGVAASNAQLDMVSETLLWCYRELQRTPTPDVYLVARMEPSVPARSTGEWSPRRPVATAESDFVTSG